MTTGSLLAADLVFAVLRAAGWLGGGAAAAARRRPLALATGRRRAARHVRPCAHDHRARAAPAGGSRRRRSSSPLRCRSRRWSSPAPRLLRPPRRHPRPSRSRCSSPGTPQASALLVTVLHGYPASAGAGLLAVAGVAAATAVSWRVLGPPPVPDGRPAGPCWWRSWRCWPAPGWPPHRPRAPAYLTTMNIRRRPGRGRADQAVHPDGRDHHGERGRPRRRGVGVQRAGPRAGADRYRRRRPRGDAAQPGHRARRHAALARLRRAEQPGRGART